MVRRVARERAVPENVLDGRGPDAFLYATG